MNTTSVWLLVAAAATVGFLHSILPDHWVPLAVIARTQRWTVPRVARISFLASVGHVATSLIIAAVIAAVGLQFRQELETQQGHIVGVILVLTGIGFIIWSLTGHGHHEHGPGGHSHGPFGHTHSREEDDEHDDHEHDHNHEEHHHPSVREVERSALRRFAAIAGPFGAAASPDLTILPVALAASAVGIGAVVGTLISFTIATLATFVVLTVAATIAGYQVKGEWLEEHGNLITGVVLLGIGVAVYLGL